MLCWVALFAWLVFLLLLDYAPVGMPIIFGIRAEKPQVPDVGLLAAASAIVGWITTSAISRANSIKQQTMSVLTQVRLS